MATDLKDDIAPFALGIGPPTTIDPLKPETRSIVRRTSSRYTGSSSMALQMPKGEHYCN
jgi:hypothetical protein